MYLLPWQIFVMGCICGVVISVIVMISILLRLAFRGGVKVERVEHDKEENDNG